MSTISPWLIRYCGDETSSIRLFCFHFAGGSALAFRRWAEYLPDDIELIAIQLPGRDGRYAEPVLTDVSQIVDCLIAEMAPYLNKTYILFGHSLGALICYELIRVIEKLKLTLPKLFIPSSHRAPHLPAKAQTIYNLSDKEFIIRLGEFDGTSKTVLENEDIMAAFLPRIRADFKILETYVHRRNSPLKVPILALKGRDDSHVSEADLLGWAEQTENFKYHLFDGGHFFIETAKAELLNLIKHECNMLRDDLSTETTKGLAYLFPGQGSQYKGMGGTLFDEFPRFVDQADDILGYSVKSFCLENRDNLLNHTQYTQPALYVVNVLAYQAKVKETGELPAYCAGHSLGEYNALYAAGALSFEYGLHLVKKRGELMSLAREGAMAAILNIEEHSLKQCLADNQLENIDIANYNSALQTVISGSKNDISRSKAPLEALGAHFHPLNTSGAFHSRYMADAKREFQQYIQPFSFYRLGCPVIANIHAGLYKQNAIADTLLQQITGSVRWKESMEYLLRQGVCRFEETGPGNVLTKLVKQIEKDYLARESNIQASFENIHQQIAHWNNTYPVGTSVRVKGYGEPLETRTQAVVLFGHRAAIYMNNYNGYFDLDDIAPVART